MGSEGFIQDPATKETKRFHRDEKSWTRDPKVFVDTGRPIPGEPPLLKTRVHRVGTQQSSSGGSCIALAGNRLSLVGELLLSPRTEGVWGRVASFPIRNEGSEISVGFQERWIQKFSSL